VKHVRLKLTEAEANALLVVLASALDSDMDDYFREERAPAERGRKKLRLALAYGRVAERIS
jgi:hypothetical protein